MAHHPEAVGLSRLQVFKEAPGLREIPPHRAPLVRVQATGLDRVGQLVLLLRLIILLLRGILVGRGPGEDGAGAVNGLDARLARR